MPKAFAPDDEQPTPGGSSRAAARDARRTKLLVAAADILESSHEAFTTNAVAQRSGVPVASLYKLFRDKDDLLLALLDQEGQRFEAGIVPGAQKQMRRAAAGRLVSALIGYYRGRPRLAAALLREEQRLQAHKPAGVLDKTDNAAFALLEESPSLANTTLAARSAALMLCGMAVAASTAHSGDLKQAEAGMSAALAGYLSWYYNPQ